MRIGVPAGKARQALARLAPWHRRLAIARHRIIFGIGHDRGARPFVHVAEKAVGMPPEPSSTVKPSARSVFTYHSAERYSRHAVSARCQMWEFHADHSGMVRLHPVEGGGACGIGHDIASIKMRAAFLKIGLAEAGEAQQQPLLALAPGIMARQRLRLDAVAPSAAHRLLVAHAVRQPQQQHQPRGRGIDRDRAFPPPASAPRSARAAAPHRCGACGGCGWRRRPSS